MVAGWVVADRRLLDGDWLTSGSCVRVLAERVRVCARASSCFCFYSTGLNALLQHVHMLRGLGRLPIAEARGIRHDPLFWRDRWWIAAECQLTCLG